MTDTSFIDSPRRILLVDDDAALRQTLSAIFEKESWIVVQASNGFMATEMLNGLKFDAIIADVKMPVMSGTELLTYVREKFDTPVILITGFMEALEARRAHDLGAAGFLVKPFRSAEILSIVREVIQNRCLTRGDQPDLDGEFCKLHIDEFVSGSNVLVDIYVRLSATKYIKVAHKGTKLAIDRIRAYKSKGLSLVYMRSEDFSQYVGLNLALTRVANKDKSKEFREKKLKILKHTSEVLAQEIFVNGLDKTKFNEGKSLVENTVNVLMEDEDISTLLTLLQTHSDYLYAHSLAVSVYSVLIGKAVKWSATPTLFKISMGGAPSRYRPKGARSCYRFSSKASVNQQGDGDLRIPLYTG